MHPAVYPRAPTLAQRLTGLMHDAMVLMRHEVGLAIHMSNSWTPPAAGPMTMSS
jgi:hypothetical protein